MFSEKFFFQLGKTVEGLSSAEGVAKERHFLATSLVVDILHVCDVVVFPEIVKAEVPVGWCPVVSQIVVLAICISSGVCEPNVKATVDQL